MAFDLSFSRSAGQAAPRDPDEPLRLLLLADLGGDRQQPLAQRRALAVDIDRFDAVLARVGPRLELALDEQALSLRFQSLDDFHPDALFDRVDAFASLRRLRDEARDARQLGRVAAALGLAADAAPAPSAAASADAGDDIARLLGRPASAAAAQPAAAGALDAWLRSLVAPHVQPDQRNQQQAVLQALDAALGTLMRRVLHHPALQAVEAAWRGVDRLVRGLDLGESVQLQVFDVGADELAQELAAHQADLSRSALHALLHGSGADAPRPGLLVVDHAFGPADIASLAALGALAARAGAPLLANAAPALAGAACSADLVDPLRWQPEDAPELAAWQALRGAPMAAHLGLVLPRVLMRLPYGPATDPVSRFAFEELGAEPGSARAHDAYLWGGGAVSLALLAGQAFQRDGWAWSCAEALELDDLPSHVWHDEGESHQQAAAEWMLSETAARALAARGLMPLASYRHRPGARLLAWQSVATPAQPIHGLGS